MEKRYPIGRFSKMTNVTPRTLHYYDEIGLIKAKRTETGHRYYTKNDLFTLQQIVSLKFLGYSLETIQEILAIEKWNTAEYFTFQKNEMIKKREQIDQAIRLLDHAQKLIDEKGELDPDIFFLLINSVQMKEEHKEWLKTMMPAHIVDEIYEITEEEQLNIEEQFIHIINRLKETNLNNPKDKELQQCIRELFTFAEEILGSDVFETLTNLEDIEFSEEDEWLFPSYLFTPEEEEKIAKAFEIYLANEGDDNGKENQS